MFRKLNIGGDMYNLEDAKRLGKLLSEARYEAGVSQGDMAAALGISRTKVSQLEQGVGRLTIKQFLDWFNILGKNPTSYMLQYLNPNELDGINASSSDEEIEEALQVIIKSLTIKQKRALLYFLFGSHQSDVNAMLQLALAHLHNPLENRVTIARTVIDNYEMCEKRGTLVELDHIMPDIEILKQACETAKTAVMKGENGYTLLKED